MTAWVTAWVTAWGIAKLLCDKAGDGYDGLVGKPYPRGPRVWAFLTL